MNEFISIITQPAVCGLLQFLILIPVIAGVLLFLVPEKYISLKGIFALLISLVSGYLTISLFTSAVQMTSLSENIRKGCLTLFGMDFVQDATRYVTFTVDNLSKLIIVFVSLFAFLIMTGKCTPAPTSSTCRRFTLALTQE